MNIGRITVRTVGIQGPAGPAGQNAGMNFVQVEPATSWVVEHGFDYAPCVAVVSLDGDEVMGAVAHSTGVTTITFSEPLAGTARLV